MEDHSPSPSRASGEQLHHRPAEASASQRPLTDLEAGIELSIDNSSLNRLAMPIRRGTPMFSSMAKQTNLEGAEQRKIHLVEKTKKQHLAFFLGIGDAFRPAFAAIVENLTEEGPGELRENGEYVLPGLAEDSDLLAQECQQEKRIEGARFNIIRLLALVLNWTTTSYNLYFLCFPINDRQFWLFVAYSLMSFLIFGVLLLSFLEKSSAQRYVSHCFVYVVLRLILAMLDFGGIHLTLQSHNWALMVVVQYSVVVAMIVLYFNIFQSQSLAFGIFLTVLTQIAAILSLYSNLESFHRGELITVGFVLFCNGLYYKLWSSVFKSLNGQSLKLMKESVQNHREFTTVFNSLQEPIFIVSDSRIEFANSSFSSTFFDAFRVFNNHAKTKTFARATELAQQQVERPKKTALRVICEGLQKQYKDGLALIGGESDLQDRLNEHSDAEMAALRDEVAESQLRHCSQFLDLKIFKEYKRTLSHFQGQQQLDSDLEQQTFSIADFFHMSDSDRSEKKFILLDKNSIRNQNDLNSTNIQYVSSYSAQGLRLGDDLLEDGSQRCFQVKIINYSKDEQLKSIVQFVDMTNEMKQDQYKAQNKLLEMINACVSHELRNPLNSIMAQNFEKEALYATLEEVSLKLDRLVAREQAAHKLKASTGQVQSIVRQLRAGMRVQMSSTNLMQFMVQDLLDFAQIANGRFRKNPTRFDVRETVARVMQIQRKKAEDRSIVFSAEFPNLAVTGFDGVGTFSPFVRTDEERVMQVLLCLQSNALKFTEAGSVTIVVRVVAEGDRKRLAISVVDTGIGIEPEDQDKLFRLFGFVDKKKLNTQGIGLGLVIASQVTSQFGGTIELDSVPGQGSTFSFSFELEPDNEVEDEAGLLGSPSESSFAHSLDSSEEGCAALRREDPGQFATDRSSDDSQEENHARILAVDDQMYNLDALEIILKYEIGFPTEARMDRALSGQVAVDLVAKNMASHGGKACDYSLVLMDCNMPVMSGYEATEEIRRLFAERGLEQPLISAVTGHVEEPYLAKCRECGMDQVLSKPVKWELLKELVDKIN